MTRTKCYRHMLAGTIAFLTLSTTAQAGMFGLRKTPATLESTLEQDVEPTLILSNAMQEVQETLKTIANQPSCQRIAAKSFLGVCGSFNGRQYDGPESTEEMIQNFQQLYAIRMARCDLERAEQPMPEACFPLLNPNLVYVQKQDMTPCTAALYKQDSNGWTTFKSMETNAHIMCHAWRAEIDKDENIHFLQVLLTKVGDVGSFMNKHSVELDRLKLSFHDIRNGMTHFFGQLHNDQEHIKQMLKDTHLQIQATMIDTHSGISELMEKANAAVGLVTEHSDRLQQTLEQATAISTGVDVSAGAVARLSENIQKMQDQHDYQVQMVITDFAQMVFTITNSVEIANNLTQALTNNVELLNTELNLPLAKVGEMNHGMDVALQQQTHLQAQLSEIGVMVNVTRESVDILHQQVGTMGVVFSIFDHAIGFAAHLLSPFIIFVLSFGISASTIFTFLWYYGAPLWVVLPATATGASVLSFILAVVLPPLAQSVIDHHPQFSEHISRTGSMLIVYAFGAISVFALTKYFQKQDPPREYDPESPRYIPDISEKNECIA